MALDQWKGALFYIVILTAFLPVALGRGDITVGMGGIQHTLSEHIPPLFSRHWNKREGKICAKQCNFDFEFSTPIPSLSHSGEEVQINWTINGWKTTTHEFRLPSASMNWNDDDMFQIMYEGTGGKGNVSPPAFNLSAAPPLASPWLGLYSPSSSDHTYYVDFYPLSNEDIERGEGSLKVFPTNLRTDGFEVRLFMSGFSCACRSPLLTFKEGTTEPTQIHASLFQDRKVGLSSIEGNWVAPSKLVLTWTSSSSSPEDIVFERGNVGWNMKSEVASYSASDMCNPPATSVNPWNFIHPGYFHSILVSASPLPTSFAFPHSAKTFTVKGHLEAGNPSPFSALLLADVGVSGSTLGSRYGTPRGTDTLRLASRITRNEDVLLACVVGDLSYAHGVGMIWDRFMDELQGLATQVPVMVAPGNHEIIWTVPPEVKKQKMTEPEIELRTWGKGGRKVLRHNNPVQEGEPTTFSSKDAWGLDPFNPEWGNMQWGDSKGECGVPLAKRFPFPPTTEIQEGEGGGGEAEERRLDEVPSASSKGLLWYSYEVGMVHFLSISTEHDWTLTSPQIAFIKKDLASVDRSVTPWVVVLGHRPIYTAEIWEDDLRVTKILRKVLAPIFEEFEVNLYFSGHDHVYEVSCPLRVKGEGGGGEESPLFERCVSPGDGFVSILGGMGGAFLDSGEHKKEFWVDEMILAFGLVKMEVQSADVLVMEFRGIDPKEGEGEEEGGTLLHRFEIVQYESVKRKWRGERRA